MAAVVWAISGAFLGAGEELAEVATAVAAGVVVYVLAAKAMKVRELDVLFRLPGRRT
jgi:hypothetical protein